MEKEKQIEEMAKVIEKVFDDLYYEGYDPDSEETARALYAANYRKASDVAKEIFAEIEKIIDKHYNKHIFDSDLEDTEIEAVMDFSGDISYDIYELKNKYAEDGE